MSDDYSFLRTGSNGFYTERTFSIEETITSILIVLLKNAFNKLDNWCRHRGILNPDTEISFDLIKTFLRIETIIFLDTPNLNERIQEVLQNLDNDLEDLILEDAEHQQNTPVEFCNCNDCEIVNNIETIWENFTPNDGFIQLLKRQIDNIDINDFFN